MGDHGEDLVREFAAWIGCDEHERYVEQFFEMRVTTPPVAPRCVKVPHVEGWGYLHAADFDGLYNVDGAPYCGRCHQADGVCQSRADLEVTACCDEWPFCLCARPAAPLGGEPPQATGEEIQRAVKTFRALVDRRSDYSVMLEVLDEYDRHRVQVAGCTYCGTTSRNPQMRAATRVSPAGVYCDGCDWMHANAPNVASTPAGAPSPALPSPHHCPRCGEPCYCAEFYDGLPCCCHETTGCTASAGAPETAPLDEEEDEPLCCPDCHCSLWSQDVGSGRRVWQCLACMLAGRPAEAPGGDVRAAFCCGMIEGHRWKQQHMEADGLPGSEVEAEAEAYLEHVARVEFLKTRAPTTEVKDG